MMAKYLATSLAIENVVSAPRVISSCLPISTISMSLVGLESRSTMLPASPPPRELAFALFVADESQFVFGRRLGKEVTPPRLSRNRGGGGRVVARNHDG